MRKYLVQYSGGEGEDAWNREFPINAYSFSDAARKARKRAIQECGSITSIGVIKTPATTPSETTSEGHFPAFPTENEHQSGPNTFHYSGITIRDYFAAKAMNGDLASQTPETGEYDTKSIPMLVERAYRIADAMIAERAKK